MFQHVFQDKPDQEIGFAEDTKGGSCAYSELLLATPFVAACNESTRNLHLLDTDDFLSKRDTCVVLHLTESPFQDDDVPAAPDTPPAGSGHITQAITDGRVEPSAAELMSLWTVREVCAFLENSDLCSAAKIVQRNDVNGRDFVAFTTEQLQAAFSMTSFLAGKVVAARQLRLDGHH